MNPDIITLQEKIVHLEDTISHISDELYTQQKAFNELKTLVRTLQEKVESNAEENNARPLNEETPPPHY